MKVYVFAFLLVIGTAFAGSSELTSSEERFLQEMMNNYRGEAKEYVRNSMKELSDAVCQDKNYDLQAPLEEVIQRAEEVDVTSETVCGLIKNHLIYIVDPLAKAIDDCMPNEDAGFAQYGVKAFVSAMSYLCNLNGEHILELINPCIEDVDLEEGQCIENVAQKWELVSTSNKPFKEVACSEYSDMRPCLSQAIEKACKLPVTKDSIIGLIDAAFKTPCEA